MSMSKRTESGVINMTEKEQKELFEKLLAKEEKAKARAKAYRDNNKEKASAWSERARVRQQLLARKAKEAGISVSDEEIDEYIANMK